ncbi:MAG TPA: hypothetical protein VFS08_02865 [Gemmatimonadaceae bacterium]|nr:hypothetical protein [Gemmatimonadaceae bacterium]
MRRGARMLGLMLLGAAACTRPRGEPGTAETGQAAPAPATSAPSPPAPAAPPAPDSMPATPAAPAPVAAVPTPSPSSAAAPTAPVASDTTGRAPVHAGAAPDTGTATASVRELLDSSALVGRVVRVTGLCLGYGRPTAAGPQPRTRSDWQLQADGATIWVTGRRPPDCSATEGATAETTIEARVAEDTLPSLGGSGGRTRRYLVRVGG